MSMALLIPSPSGSSLPFIVTHISFRVLHCTLMSMWGPGTVGPTVIDGRE